MNIRVKPAIDFRLEDLNRGMKAGTGKEEAINATVTAIINEIKTRGDEALFEYTNRYDGVRIDESSVKVTQNEILEAFNHVDSAVIDALQVAKANIELYHKKQLLSEWTIETTPGVKTSMLVRPLETVGVYVPGGKAFYPSTVLMCAIPAVVAGVKRIIMVTPPRKDGTIEPIVLASASVAGIKEIYKVGGAQAIAALATGTNMIPKVDCIVGPGNAYVSMAKKLLQGEVLIDSPAGPSEILIVAGQGTSPTLVALDMCAQAEHDEDAISIAIVPNENVAGEIIDQINILLDTLDRAEIIQTSLERNGWIIVLGTPFENGDSMKEVARLINMIAPEHLQLNLDRSKVEKLIPRIENAGAIFIGRYSPVALGDYASGTNHVLPTNGLATRYSALNCTNFLKIIPVTEASAAGLKGLGNPVIKIARLETLEAHARSVQDRLEMLEREKNVK